MPLGIIQSKGDTDPPGTEFLLDNDETKDLHPYEHAHLKHGTGKYADIILIPQPSNDPNDPLLWPRWRKEVAFLILFVNNMMFATVPGPLLASSAFVISKALDVDMKMVSELGGYQLLLTGAIGPFVSVFAKKYGKRPQFIFAAVMGLIGTFICIGATSSYNVLLAGRVIQGFGATAFESLSQAAVGDMFYMHERGWRTALMVLTLATMASMASIISGVITQREGWRYLFYILLPFQIFFTLATIFLVPEMQFRRPKTPPQPHHTEERTTEVAEKNKDSTTLDEIEKKEKESPAESVDDGGNDSAIPKRKTYVQTLAVFSGTYTEESIFSLLFQIAVHLLNPAVMWILVVSGVLISLFAGAAYILAQVWSAAPYHLNAAQNGYFYTGAFVGGLLGVSTGWMCDVSARMMARRNKGVFEAEFRIPINILAALFLGLGWFVWMWDVNHPKPHGYYLGAVCHAMSCFGITVTSTSGALYIIDAFRPYSTEIFILQMMTKNFFFYMWSQFINDWTRHEGPGVVFRAFGILSLSLVATCIPMYIFGKLNRKFVHEMWQKYMPAKAVAG